MKEEKVKKATNAKVRALIEERKKSQEEKRSKEIKNFRY